MSVIAGPWPGRRSEGSRRGQLADRAAVLGRVVGHLVGRLEERGAAGEVVEVADDVTADRDPVGVAEEDHLAGCVAGGMDDAEARDLVALSQHPVDLARWAGPDPVVDARDQGGAGADRAPALHRVDVVGVAGERHPPRLADPLRAALVVGVDVGQGEFGNLDLVQLGEDPPPVPFPPGVDQHVLGQVDVDPGSRELLQAPDTGCQALHLSALFRGCGATRRSRRQSSPVG